jgi:hypothetical protein
MHVKTFEELRSTASGHAFRPASTKPMLYSAYQRYTIILVAAVVVVSNAAALLLFSWAGVVLCVIIDAFAIGYTWLGLTLTKDRLEEYGGRIPMPTAGLGLWGFDVIDDKFAGSYVDPFSEKAIDYSSNELDQHPFAPRCPYCHSLLGRADAKFCNECGKSLPAGSTSPTPGSTKS